MNDRDLHQRILAKSGTWEDELPYAATLVGHLEQTFDAAEIIADSLGEKVLDIIGVQTDYVLVRKTLGLAAVFHDLGKASFLFQTMIHNRARKETPPIRHELISDWMLTNHSELWNAVHEFLGADNPSNRWTLVALRSAISGHHLKLSDTRVQGTSYDEFSPVYWDHPDLQAVRHLIGTVLGRNVSWSSGRELSLNIRARWLDQNILNPLILFIEEESKNLTESELRLASLIRALLIAADTMGSVFTRTRDEWRLQHLPKIEQALRNQGLNEQLQSLINQAGNYAKEDQEVSEFQDQVAAVTAQITLVEAGCGSGKTLAAYRWARASGKPFLFMMYPTTATATQGYHDYALTLGKDAQLVHSRSLVDMEYLGIGEDVEDEKKQTEGVQHEKERISQALERLTHSLTICTADTVLGVMQNYRSSLLLLPVLLQSALVFDEIHSYDDSLFEHMVRFLKTFQMPALLMTASLQPERRELLNRVFSGEDNQDQKQQEHQGKQEKQEQQDQDQYQAHRDFGHNLIIVEGPVRRQHIKRYKIELEYAPPLAQMRQALESGKKVLIVLNTVERAVDIYQKVKKELMGLKVPLYLYHSHFKYIHRLQRQQEIMTAFEQGPCCVVTTQISEMSFDISADVLFSEIAPFASVIQRLGRLNRYAESEINPGRAYFWMPDGKNPYLPYTKAELMLGAEILQELAGAQGISQVDLSDYQAQYASRLSRSLRQFMWDVLDSAVIGPSLRESGSISLDYILRSDYHDVVQKFHGTPALEMMKYILPLIGTGGIPEAKFKRWRHVRIIEDASVSYDYETGGRWQSGGMEVSA